MSTWTADELDRIGDAEELEIASRRPDGSLRPFVTIWMVRVGDAIYVRSAHGPENGWFRRAAASGAGAIRSVGVERDVVFAQPDPAVHGELDAAYHAKYDHYDASIVDPVVGAVAASATLLVTPALSHD